MSSFGRINSIEKFKEIKELNTGIVLITDYATGNHVHLPDCVHVTEENFNEKVVQNNSQHGEYFWYENIPHTMKEHNDLTSCSTCHPDFKDMKMVLNDSGTFLQVSVLKQLKNHEWGPEPEFPTSLAPFIKDPTKYPGISPGYPGIIRASLFPQAVSESQNQFLKKETSIDGLGSKIHNDINYLLCTQVKKLNPKYVDWCFFKQGNSFNKFRVTTKSILGGGLVDLMTIPPTKMKNGKAVHIQIENFDIPNTSLVFSDFGVALHKDPNGKKYTFQNSSLNNAVTQCIESTYGILVNALVHQVTTGDGYDINSQIFVPVIVTNANLFLCDFNTSNINSQTGEISDLNFKSLDHIVYEYPTPMTAQFPKSVIGTRNEIQLKMAIRWPVLITNPTGFENILSNLDAGIFNS